MVRLNSDSLHDLMSPVNQLCTMAELILKGPPLQEDGQILMGFIQKAAKRLQLLMGGLKTYIQVVGPEVCCRRSDANALLAGALASVQPEIAASDALVTHDSLPELFCDPNQMMYTFTSLLDNAIKFRRETRPEVHISATPENGNWIFSVRDNGIGIASRNRERIFGTFKRIDAETYPGPGVGLAIVRQIIEQHGGRIWVESELGQGATFFFTLPRALSP
jgi:chemotaxis family two-component system sensor kinase Cph1